MKQKIVYITGGTKGIGLGIAQYLLEKGMRVALSGRSQQSLDKALSQLNSTEAMGIISDVSKYEDETAALAKIAQKWGMPSVVIANAGVGNFAPIHEMTLDEWNQMINTNLTGCFHTLKASFESLKATKGYYISIASLAGVNFFANGAGYNASKFGVVGFSQAAMLDLRKFDIKVSTIMPGSVASEFNGNVPSKKDAWKIQPEDIARLVWDLLQMHPRTLPSKVEVRPTRPDLKSP